MSPFRPLIGDMADCISDIEDGKVFYAHKILNVGLYEGHDLRIRFEGTVPCLNLISNKSIEEFINLQPHKIDRGNSGRGLPKFGRNTFFFVPSTKRIMGRRKQLGNFLNLNKASTYIPGIVEHTVETIDRLEVGTAYEFIHEMNILTFSIFTSVMFGKDANSLANKQRIYENPDGSTEELPLREFMIRLFKAYFSQNFNPIALVFQFLCDYNLCNPFIRDEKNKEIFFDGMRELFKN